MERGGVMAHAHGLGVIKFCRQGGRQGIQEEGLDNSFYPKFIDIDPLSSIQPDTQNLRPCLLCRLYSCNR